MELSISVCQKEDCSIVITDNTDFYPNRDGFIPQSGVSANLSYKLSDVYLHTYLVYNKVSGSEVVDTDIKLIDTTVVTTYSQMVPPITFRNYRDGYYTVYYLAIPNQTISQTSGRYTDSTLTLYYSDGENIYLNGTTLALNPLQVLSNLWKTNIISIDNKSFSICRINKCYLDYIYSLSFDSKGRIKCFACDSKDLAEYKKKLLSDAIFVIRSLIDQCLYMEAQNIVEEIMQCNGLCSHFSDFVNPSACCGGTI